MHERIKYPDGQISARLSSWSGIEHIAERINSYEDLIYVKSIAEAMRHKKTRHISLFIPCMFGQRSDRRFTEEQSFDLKIITDIINSCEFNNVEVFDPHSDVTLALINNSIKRSSYNMVYNFIYRNKLIDPNNLVLVSPDAGAYKKIFEYGEKMKLPVIAANKHRDLDGKIDLHITGDVKGKECFIVDDLADGGYTFYLLAKQLKEQGAIKVFLYVSHAYFNKGFDLLKEYIDHIYCTNSVKEIKDDFVTQLQII